MSTIAGLAFDRIAKEYDALWTKSAVGQFQRAQVWRRIDPLVKAGDKILDLGCGTGEDALHMIARGAQVHAIDASAEMVRHAQSRGVDAQHLAIESLSSFGLRRHAASSGEPQFGGALSNFGVLNCVRDLKSVALTLGRLIRPGGFLAICLMGGFCFWESCYFLARGDLTKASRRWRRNGASSSMGIRVTYPSLKRVRYTFGRDFKLTDWYGIGFSVPPSYVRSLSPGMLAYLAKLDRHVDGWPLLRALADHRLFLFERL
jgi:SAM-dependent methyltransferase